LHGRCRCTGAGRRAGHDRRHRAPGDRAVHHGRGVRGRDPLGHAAGHLVQVHQETLRGGTPDLPHGPAASPFRGERLEGNPGGGPLLDHHHDAGPDRPGEPETAMTNACEFPSVRRDGLTLILGLGETGVAAARWCAAQGARLRVLDTRAQPGGLAELQADGIVADLRLGPQALTEDALDEVHTLVLSPGLVPHEAPVAGLLAAARARQIDVLGEIELFARALADLRPQGYAPALVAVTGTNGKTTVTAMMRHLAA